MNLVNGKSSSSISIFDRGFLYGDGIFETILVINKTLINWPLHLKRIRAGCSTLKFKKLNYDLLSEHIIKATSNVDNCVLSVNITRGTAKKRGYNINVGEVNPNIILTTSNIPDYPDTYTKTGIHTKFSKNTLSDNGQLSKIKHLNRLEQVLATSEISKKFPEIILCDKNHNIIEGTASNIFFIKKDTYYSPLIEDCGVEGAMKSFIIKAMKRNKIKLKIKKIKEKEIGSYDGAFFCNSIRLVWNIKSVDGVTYKKNNNILKLIKIINDEIYK